MCECFVCSVYAPHAHRPYRGQKQASDPLELKFQMVVSCCVDIGKQTRVLWKKSKCS